MYIDRCTTTVNGKSYTRILLRRSERIGKKVTHHVVANLTDWPPQAIAALELALRHRRTLAALHALDSQLVQLRQGASIGAVWLLKELAEREGITAALGAGRDGRLALWQVIARTLEHGSRLSAVRLAESHAACAVLQTAPFTEDHLYANLAWLADEQAYIEQRLQRRTPPAPFPGVVLYDVTSPYLEGRGNALADWGYNRGGKRGKRQIVIGLLCDTAGRPLSVEVFRGNTADMATVAPQIKEAFAGEPQTNGVAKRFIRTLKEQKINGFIYTTLEELRTVLTHFVAQYNREWMVALRGHRRSLQIRADFTTMNSRVA